MSNIFGKIARPVLAIALALTVTTTTSGFVTTTVDNLAADKVAPEVQNSVQADDAIENPSLDVENNVDELVTPDDNKQDAPNPDDYFAPAAGENVAQVGEVGYTTLAAAIAAATEGQTITLLDNVNESVTISKAITINGNGKTLGGTVSLAVPASDTTMKFVNVVFKTANANSIITTANSYNVTFDGCTFNGAKKYAIEIPAGNNGAHNFQFINGCEVNMTGNFMQILGTASDMLVDGMHIVKCSNGFKVNKCGNAITFNEVTVDDAYIFIYGMGSGNMSFNIMNCTVKAAFPFVRQDKAVMTYTYNLYGDHNTFVANPDPTAPVVPTEIDGLYLVNGSDMGATVQWNVHPNSGSVAYRADVTDKADREGIAILLKDVVATESLVVKVYHDDTLMFTCTRRDIDDEGKVMFPVLNTNTTANIVLWGKESGSWENEILVKPTTNNIPNKIEVWADGVLTDAYTHSTDTVLGDQIEKYRALDCVEKIVDVAEINGVGYATLAEAIAAANAGDTITFLADVNENVTIDKAITINGAGFKYIGKMTVADEADSVDTVKFVNVKFFADTAIGNNVIVDIQKNVEAIFDGCDFTSNSTDTYYNSYKGITVANNCTVDLKNCTASKLYYMIHIGQSSKSLTVENCTLTNMVYGIGAFKCENVAVKSFTYSGMASGINVKNSDDSILALENVNITTTMNGQAPVAMWMPDSGNPSVKYTITLKGENIANGAEMTVENEADWFARQDESNLYEIKNLNGLAGSGTEADPYQIGSVEDLIMFRDSVNAGETKYSAPGVYVELTADIDLAGINWVGIGSATAEHGFMGNFDGNGKVIKNLTITNPALDSDGYAYAGLFSVTEGTDKDNQNIIKNLTIENVTINTTGHIVAAAIAYPYYTTVDNIKVCGNIAINGGDYTAGVLAYTRRCVNARNLTVEGTVGSYITGKQTVGGVISDIQMNGGLTANYSNFSAICITVEGNMNVGGISGIISGQTLNGVYLEYVKLVCNDARVGIVSGSLGNISTISNVDVFSVKGATSEIGGTYNDGAAIQAKVGDTYYKTLKEALAAAANGDTVTLLSDLALTEEGAVEYSTGKKVMLYIDKSITFNLNGKTISAVNNSNEMIYAIVAVAPGASVTVTGNGAIDANHVDKVANGQQDIGYMFLNLNGDNEGKLIIENGNFHANNLEDSMVYANGTFTVQVKGGTFVLDAIGTRANGHPWIFNAKGQNIRKIEVLGGSFNADVFHQYWIFEIKGYGDKALKYDAGTGMYTVVPAVAYVTERHWSGAWYTQNVGYATLEEAIAACQGVQSKIYYSKEYLSEPEVVILLDHIEGAIRIKDTITIAADKNVIIDLNGRKIVGEFSGTGNQEMFLVKGNLTVKNGQIEMTATVNQGWGAMATIFDVTAGGVLNMDKINATVSGTDMNFIVHLNNWGEVTLNVTSSTLNATYCAVRVFNSGYDMNNVTIENSKLTGKTRAFWVHNYIGDLDSNNHSNDAIKGRLNFDIFNNGNTFEITDEATEYPIRYGYNDETTVFYTAEGQRVVNTLEDFQNAINNGESNIILGGDIDLSNGFVFP